MNAMTATTRTHLYDITDTFDIRGFPFIIRVYEVDIVEGTYSWNAASDVDYYGYEDCEWTLCVEGEDGRGNKVITEVPGFIGELTENEYTHVNARVIADAYERRTEAREDARIERAIEAREDARFGAFDDIPW